MYVRAEDLVKWTGVSLESHIEMVEAALSVHVGAPVEILATRDDGVLFRAPDGTLHEAAFTSCVGDNGPTVADVVVTPSTISVYKEADLTRLVSEELRSITADLISGKTIERTRVRSVADLLVAGESYSIGQLLGRIDEACVGESDDHWFSLYEANQERIRTAMWGSIREIEGSVPQTAYSKLPKGRLGEFDAEMRESMTILGGVIKDVIDEIIPLVFDSGRDEFLGAIRESLNVEAQTLHGLLAKVEQLMRADDLERVAVAHDRLCGRAKTMKVVSAYLTGRAKKGSEESK